MRLQEYQVERLVSDCTRKGGSFVDTSWLQQRIDRLESALSGILTDRHQVAALCCHDIDVLDPAYVDEEAVKAQLQGLTEIFGSIHVLSIISSQPRLLYLTDAPGFSLKIIDKLVKIWPYKGNQTQKRKDVIDTIAQYPMLLLRMQFYLDDKVKRIQDLPIDIQNNLLKNYCG